MPSTYAVGKRRRYNVTTVEVVDSALRELRVWMAGQLTDRQADHARHDVDLLLDARGELCRASGQSLSHA